MAETRSRTATSKTQTSSSEPQASLIANLQEQNDVLISENEELRRIAKYRSAFLSRLAHELRTPLTSILGFAEIMLSLEELTEPQHGFCERIQNSALQLRNSLNQLSDLARLEAGQYDLNCEEFSLDALLQEACEAIRRAAQKHPVEVRVSARPELPMIVSDRGKLWQVVFSFMAYASCRSPEGSPVIATAEKDAAGFLLTFEDLGDCLPEPFVLGELDISDRRSGSNELGLAIARHNIDLLGATMSAGNRTPRGLTVKIQLPLSPPEKPMI